MSPFDEDPSDERSELDMCIDEIKSLQSELAVLKAENQSFSNVLAIIHRDGGHYITKHGHEKASEDAIKIIVELRLSASWAFYD